MEEVQLLSAEDVQPWLVRRTYKVAGESTLVTTVEVPESVIRAFGYSKTLAQIEKFRRGRIKSKASAIKKRAIIEGHELGKNNCQIAREVGCSPAYVAHIVDLMS